LIWVPSHARTSENEADQAAKDAFIEEIGNQEPYSPHYLIKWIKKEESSSTQERWERSENEMKNRKTSVSWQNDTVKLSRREQVIISRLRTGYTRATRRHIIVKKLTHQTAHSAMYGLQQTIFYGSATKETNAASNALHSMEGRKRRQQKIG
jgi:hypothetical protein